MCMHELPWVFVGIPRSVCVHFEGVRCHVCILLACEHEPCTTRAKLPLWREEWRAEVLIVFSIRSQCEAALWMGCVSTPCLSRSLRSRADDHEGRTEGVEGGGLRHRRNDKSGKWFKDAGLEIKRAIKLVEWMIGQNYLEGKIRMGTQSENSADGRGDLQLCTELLTNAQQAHIKDD